MCARRVMFALAGKRCVSLWETIRKPFAVAKGNFFICGLFFSGKINHKFKKKTMDERAGFVLY